MTQGIRAFALATFAAQLPALNAKEVTNTQFRAEVMGLTMAAFEGVTLASAATHYNHALKEAKKNTPELVVGLGRPDDKKGGRKPIHLVDVVKAKSGEVVATGLSNAAALAMVEKAAAAGKTKLAIKVVVKEEAPAADASETPAADATVDAAAVAPEAAAPETASA